MGNSSSSKSLLALPLTSFSAPACVLLVNYIGTRGQLSCIPAKWQFWHTDNRLETSLFRWPAASRAQSDNLQLKLWEGVQVVVTALWQHWDNNTDISHMVGDWALSVHLKVGHDKYKQAQMEGWIECEEPMQTKLNSLLQSTNWANIDIMG